MRPLAKLLLREEGQDLIEYALLASLIAIVSIALLRTLGQTVSNVFSNVNSKLQ